MPAEVTPSPSASPASTSKPLARSPSGPGTAASTTTVTTANSPTYPDQILFLGPYQSGKTSILATIFRGMNPTQSLYLGTTRRPEFTEFRAFVDFQAWDFPGSPNSPFDPEAYALSFSRVGSMVYVIDAKAFSSDDPQETTRRLAFSMTKAFLANPNILFEIFIHKVEGMWEENREETQLIIRERLLDQLADMTPISPPPHMTAFPTSPGPSSTNIEASIVNRLRYHMTSIFDDSVYRAMSSTVGRLIPQQNALEMLLNLLVQQCSMQKAFLFDFRLKLYVATDSSPVDSETHAICSEYIDLILDFQGFYSPPHHIQEFPSLQPSRQPSPTRRPPGQVTGNYDPMLENPRQMTRQASSSSVPPGPRPRLKTSSGSQTG